MRTGKDLNPFLLNYCCDKMLEMKVVHEDARGKIYGIEKDGKRVLTLIGFNKGAPRGGHSHPIGETLRSLYGEADFRFINPNEDRFKYYNASIETTGTIRDGESIDVPAGMAHLFTARTDALFLELIDGEYEATVYEPYREIVNDYLAKH